ncbi:MAG: hypothetical protein U1C33_06955, partial [Candidatus Cloacimonadaceae bacterium]|nr:hypothetical protein [Candidatus Cloacimonadaceae bacterium]
KVKHVVGIGLTVYYLAVVIKKCWNWTDDMRGVVISRQELETLSEAISQRDIPQYQPWLIEPSNADILQISIGFIIQILDKIHASEFIVCRYGISLGFKHAKKKN